MASLLETVGSAIAKAAGGGSMPTSISEDVQLFVGGKIFKGWQSVAIKRSIKAISGGFELEVIDKWAQEQVAFQVVPQDTCTLSVAGETLITGYVDDVSPSFDKGSRSIRISGRDKAGDLVDCSAVHKPGNWSNITLPRLITLLAKPFGVTVVDDVGVTEKFANWRINPGESAFESAERAAKMRGVLLMNDGRGNIVIARTGTDRSGTDLIQGQNILSGSAKFTAKQRYSAYSVRGQSAGAGDSTDPALDFSPEGRATDAGVNRYRPLLIQAEGSADVKVCQSRAQWEATVRAARSSAVSISVAGWRRANGELWALNELVRCRSPWLGVNQDFLISSLTFGRNAQGTITQLELERPDAYTPDPTIQTKKDPWVGLVKKESAR